MNCVNRSNISVLIIAHALIMQACLPIPNRVADTPSIEGELRVDGRPLAGADLALEPRTGPSDTIRVCENAPVRLRTDRAGQFSAAPHRHWEMWLSFIGEAPEWHRPWRLCRPAGGPTRSIVWEAIFETWSNAWDSVRIICDTGSPWREDERLGERGYCRSVGAAGSL